MATFNPGHAAMQTVFKIQIDTRLAEEGLKECKLADACSKSEFKKIIRSELVTIKKGLTDYAKTYVLKNGDPRDTFKAIRTTLYKRSLGGNVNIMEPRKSAYFRAYEPPRKLKPEKPGGNRAPRTKRSDELRTYYGPSRAFVLRFLNSGTDPRKAGKSGKFTGAKRDKIDGNKWFSREGERLIIEAMERAADNIVEQVVKNFNG